MNKHVAILAAGKGTRMYSNKPKVMHELLGKSMIKYIIKATKKSDFEETTIIGGFQFEMLKEHLKDQKNLTFVEQKEQLGTGHAIKQLKQHFKNKQGALLILAGDMPLIKEKTIREMMKIHKNKKNDLTLLTVEKQNPENYGRIIRHNHRIVGIVEEKDCTIEQKRIKEINTSVYIFDIEKLFAKIDEINNNNAQNEYYLTDMISIFNKLHYKIGSYTITDESEVEGINDRPTLIKLTKILQTKINNEYMNNGVTILGSDVLIGPDVKIASDVEIIGNPIILGKTTIGSGSKIIGDTIIKNCKIEENVVIDASRVSDSKISNNTQIGPFALIRANAKIGENNTIGSFVEVKNTKTSNNVKAKHLTYIGDSEVGQSVNFGCGTITVNYDGKNKHKTKIKDKAFIGSNVSIIAPATVGQNTMIAAGSTVYGELPDNSLIIAREKQTIKKDYMINKKEKK